MSKPSKTSKPFKTIKTIKNIFSIISEVPERLKDFNNGRKHYKENKKKFKKLLMNHRSWDYDSFFEFMDVFLNDQITLNPTYTLNRPKLVKRLKILKALNKRIREDNYCEQIYKFNDVNMDDVNVGYPVTFEKFFTKRNIVFQSQDWNFNQRKNDLEYYTYLLNKTILHCWD